MNFLLTILICLAFSLTPFAKELSLLEKKQILQEIDSIYANVAKKSGMTIPECFALGEALKAVNMDNERDIITILDAIEVVERVVAFAELESENSNSVSVKAFSSLGIDLNEMVRATKIDQFMTIVQQLRFLAQSGNYYLGRPFLQLLKDTMDVRGMEFVVCFNKLSNHTNDFVTEFYTFRNGYLVFWRDVRNGANP